MGGDWVLFDRLRFAWVDHYQPLDQLEVRHQQLDQLEM
jgi:hypothetical protein